MQGDNPQPDEVSKSIDTDSSTPVSELRTQPLIVHTYKGDLALAMDTTDATVVQELLEKSREQELVQKESVVLKHQRGWYTTGGIILLILALGALAYGGYYYYKLTVKVAPSESVGVFHNTTPVIIDGIPAVEAITEITSVTPTILAVGKPYEIPIVTDRATLLKPHPVDAMRYLGIDFGEPFAETISLVRLGILNSGAEVTPFLLFSTTAPESASKEFLIAESKLLAQVAPILMIDIGDSSREVATNFVSAYMYNLPVRTLTATDSTTREKTILLYYGYATNGTIVVATNPTILKSVYDTIIRQR